MELTCDALKEEGHAVVGVTSTEDAIAQLSGEAGEFDLLITDVVMPGGGGRRLVDLVHSRAPQTQIIIVSGYDRDFLGDDQSCGTFMQKPYAIADLLDQVQSVLSKVIPGKP